MGRWRRARYAGHGRGQGRSRSTGNIAEAARGSYYHRRVYHPIVAAAGETGDILDLRLREGQVHTADGGLEFVLEVLERAERHLCGKVRRALSSRDSSAEPDRSLKRMSRHALCGPGANLAERQRWRCKGMARLVSRGCV